MYSGNASFAGLPKSLKIAEKHIFLIDIDIYWFYINIL